MRIREGLANDLLDIQIKLANIGDCKCKGLPIPSWTGSLKFEKLLVLAYKVW